MFDLATRGELTSNQIARLWDFSKEDRGYFFRTLLRKSNANNWNTNPTADSFEIERRARALLTAYGSSFTTNQETKDLLAKISKEGVTNDEVEKVVRQLSDTWPSKYDSRNLSSMRNE